MEFRCFSERGDGHPENEDYILKDHHPSDSSRVLCFLADGQGGRTDGALAARAACEGALLAAQNFPWEELISSSTWDTIFVEADRAVRNFCEGFTTLIGIAYENHQLHGASTGDSKVYYFGENDFVELTERQEKNPSVGASILRTTSFSVVDIQGTILALSDGAWKYAGFAAIKEAASNDDIDEIPEILRLAIATQHMTGQLPDDFSVIAIR